MTYARLKHIIRNAIIAYEFELENQDYETEKEAHEVLLHELDMTQKEFEMLMGRKM